MGAESYCGSDIEEDLNESTELKGFLSKWTNCTQILHVNKHWILSIVDLISDIHGWQLRYIVLKNSTLSYYKSEEDSDFGCRGAICLEKATVKESEIDDCRFDISVNNLVWYLRAENPEDKRNWVEVLKSFRVELLYVTADML